MEDELKDHLSRGRLRRAKALDTGSADGTTTEPKEEVSRPAQPEGALFFCISLELDGRVISCLY